MSLRKEGDEVFNEALDASIDKLEEIIKFVMKIWIWDVSSQVLYNITVDKTVIFYKLYTQKSNGYVVSINIKNYNLCSNHNLL